uniref:neuropeptides B/W receptor type 2-like n=1 Tax=Styela clava TaxID=7725 RepID=UPI00193A521A|nr:neuropeptides B/W receptor type 2-like [Styela clava]
MSGVTEPYHEPEDFDISTLFTRDYPVNEDNPSGTATAAVMGFISAGGLICNLVVIVVICVLKDYKKTTHWYVLNLAVADGMFLILLPLHLVQSLWNKWMFGYPLCVMYQGAFFVNYYAGVLFLAVMSFDRYIAVAHPVSVKWRTIRSRIGSFVMTAAVWIAAIGAATPLMMKTTLEGICDFNFDTLDPRCVENNIPVRECKIWLTLENSPANISGDKSFEEFFDTHYKDGFELDYESFESGTNLPYDFVSPEALNKLEDFSCSHSDNAYYRAWIYGNFVLAFVVPLSVMGACYSAILWRVRHPKIRSSRNKIVASMRRKHFTSGSDKRPSTHLDKNTRITVLVVSLVASFVVCWLPFHAMVLAKIRGINMPPGGCDKLQTAVLLIAYFNSLLNPMLYTFLGVNFYKRLKTAGSQILSFSRRDGRHGSFRSKHKTNRSIGGTKVTKNSIEPQLDFVCAESKPKRWMSETSSNIASPHQVNVQLKPFVYDVEEVPITMDETNNKNMNHIEESHACEKEELLNETQL